MFDIYIKNKEIKIIDDEKIVLIIGTGGKYEWEILTNDMKKFNVKKKSSKIIKKLTKKKYFLKVHDNVWVNTRFFKEKNTFALDNIREHISKKNSIKSNTCCYTAKCPSHNNYECKWKQHYATSDDSDDTFYKKKF